MENRTIPDSAIKATTSVSIEFETIHNLVERWFDSVTRFVDFRSGFVYAEREMLKLAIAAVYLG